jgi:hypothetical protein
LLPKPRFNHLDEYELLRAAKARLYRNCSPPILLL